MVLTNPGNKRLSLTLYLSSIFLALVALPIVMGLLMALHPGGVWISDRMTQPLNSAHPAAIALLVASSIGFSFFIQEALFHAGFFHQTWHRALAWFWSVSVTYTLFELVRSRSGMRDDLTLSGLWLGLTILLSWTPVSLFFLLSGRQRLDRGSRDAHVLTKSGGLHP